MGGTKFWLSIRHPHKPAWKYHRPRLFVFKAVQWLRSPGAFQPPPLQVDDVVYETQLDKANALRRATLERRTAEDDIKDPWIEVSPRKTIPFSHEISLEEAQDATLRTGNTSPEADNITVKFLTAVWHIIGTHVRRLFEGCLAIGHHPKPFRAAEVVMIAKPGRRDLTNPRAWRPISLLPCLGKGLERLVACRLAWACIHHGVLHPQQAGALPKRSATDLVAALVHDIEEAFARKKVATLVTMDIQGAFDTVLRNRLILRLREQGWPEHLARWAGSFMDDRSACVRYQDTITPLSPLQCGLPQGSPLSPILFLLYTEPIYRLSNPQGRFGYADDTAILCVGDTVEETAAAASRSVEEMVRWGAANGVSFDPKKTEVMHFSRSKLETAPAIRHGDVEKHPEAAMRWLGIWLDSSLSFRVHAEKWTAKSQAVAYHLRGLTNTIHGLLPSAVRSAVRACVEPVLLYGTETAPKEESAEAFLQWVETVDPTTWIVYSDGSLSSEGAASYGFAIHQNDLSICDGSGRLGSAEVFDAEATGALEGLKAALNLLASAARDIIVCLDNLVAATCLWAYRLILHKQSSSSSRR
ncbi:hypothetical protein HZS61_007813 [Fusarium oxysporum f. sp. conglutinans]|uniref:Reverse transcriptase domain-containing protein n=1 Tax=Fusarium oxysporum f. sp. conglutinans TaxID=100902 RepID=A0A8H6H1A7_FUSOX|nr:hypothetical protein HZS61_015959 [Fusarium oxysporum f. sp. conglutinans]KAF6527490.1 hypothetical protein HZS61_007792 [Fusarium oxysporum f. sp. conglutinans]KAF6527496.1 hypothetical protein HZS61_007798 [Fusarium oxysporum f. sp. conglutinans]KAF6527511.1 hypothetical protein HZS61_007813 [Fusarium oxysporum f. sp. conglutinans]